MQILHAESPGQKVLTSAPKGLDVYKGSQGAVNFNLRTRGEPVYSCPFSCSGESSVEAQPLSNVLSDSF